MGYAKTLAILSVFAHVVIALPVSDPENGEHDDTECSLDDEGSPHGEGCKRHFCFGGIPVHTEEHKPECMPWYNKTLGYVNEHTASITCNGERFCFDGGCYDFYRVLYKPGDDADGSDEVERVADYITRGPYHDPFRRPGWQCLCYNARHQMICFPPGKGASSWTRETHAGCYAPGSRHGFVNIGEKTDDGFLCTFIGYLKHPESVSEFETDDNVDSEPARNSESVTLSETKPEETNPSSK